MSGLLPLRRCRLLANTRGDGVWGAGRGGAGVRSSRPRGGQVARRPSSKQSIREPNVTHRDSYLPAQAWARSATPHATTRSGATPFPFKSPPEGVA